MSDKGGRRQSGRPDTREETDTSIEGGGRRRSSEPAPQHSHTTSDLPDNERAGANSHRASVVQDHVCQTRNDKPQAVGCPRDEPARRLLSGVVRLRKETFSAQVAPAAGLPPTTALQKKVPRG